MSSRGSANGGRPKPPQNSGAAELDTTSALLSRPMLHLVVLYASDPRVTAYARGVGQKFLDAGLDVFLNVRVAARDNNGALFLSFICAHPPPRRLTFPRRAWASPPSSSPSTCPP